VKRRERMVSIQFSVAFCTYSVIVKKVFIMLLSNMVQVVQCAAIKTNGVNMMTDVEVMFYGT
jgi:hypothetical protein